MKTIRWCWFVFEINSIQVKTTVTNPNRDDESDVEENYDDKKTFEKDDEKKMSNEHSGETTSDDIEVKNV